MYRVVLTCFDYGNPTPYVDDLSGAPYSVFPTEQAAREAIKKAVEDELICLNNLESDKPREKVPVEDSDGNIVCYDYPFRADFNGNHAAIIRFWGGDDYQIVTVYDICEIDVLGTDDIETASGYKYRGFWIHASKKRYSFLIEQYDTIQCRGKKLDEVLRWIDDWCLRLSEFWPINRELDHFGIRRIDPVIAKYEEEHSEKE